MLDEIKKMLEDYQPQSLNPINKSAVLLPLIERQGELHLVYEVRSQWISQPGDASFPGGRQEKGEQPVETAVRETLEELLIQKDQIQVLGQLDTLVDRKSIVWSFLGLIEGIEFEDIRPNLQEVETLFTLPLSYLLEVEPDRYPVKRVNEISDRFPKYRLAYDNNEAAGQWDEVLYYDLEDHLLWGFTADMTYRLAELVKDHINN